MCAGLQVTPYAWIAARSAWLSCPEELRDQLDIRIHFFGVKRAEGRQLEQAFSNQPYVNFEHNTILIDEQKGLGGEHFYQWTSPKARKFIAKIARRIPPLRSSAKLWLGRLRLGLYHQEWINQVCTDNAEANAIVVLDSDLFLADQRFYAPEQMSLDSQTYGGGWVWRNNNEIRYQGQSLYPLGTELFIINPAKHIQINQQFSNRDKSLFERLQIDHPGVDIQDATFFDTLFYASWEAQLRGYKADIRFHDLAVCHPGGVGHLRPEYLTQPMPNLSPEERISRLRVTIGRVRLHHRVLDFIRELGMADLLNPQLLNRLKQLRELIQSNPELIQIWEDETHKIEGEDHFEEVMKLITKTPTAR
ncbi:hypothetical protein [Cerasicoccus frondis]|uniref:hypothetical protein n=1 Tax=Cerasicoccus frondis TaxID=490090 RepID=UPI0028528186|nr:hypothetical protein [Cerasicoccus frondis]